MKQNMTYRRQFNHVVSAVDEAQFWKQTTEHAHDWCRICNNAHDVIFMKSKSKPGALHIN